MRDDMRRGPRTPCVNCHRWVALSYTVPGERLDERICLACKPGRSTYFCQVCDGVITPHSHSEAPAGWTHLTHEPGPEHLPSPGGTVGGAR